MKSNRQKFPGDRVRRLTLLRRVTLPTAHNQSRWDVRCDCGVTLDAIPWSTITRNGHCGCEATATTGRDAEVSYADLVKLGVITTRQAAQNLETRAIHRFEENWTHWRTIMDTDLDTASVRQLQIVVLSCRYLIKQLDRRERKERKGL
jgi:hypothetical protein